MHFEAAVATNENHAVRRHHRLVCLFAFVPVVFVIGVKFDAFAGAALIGNAREHLVFTRFNVAKIDAAVVEFFKNTLVLDESVPSLTAKHSGADRGTTIQHNLFARLFADPFKRIAVFSIELVGRCNGENVRCRNRSVDVVTDTSLHLAGRKNFDDLLFFTAFNRALQVKHIFDDKTAHVAFVGSAFGADVNDGLTRKANFKILGGDVALCANLRRREGDGVVTIAGNELAVFFIAHVRCEIAGFLFHINQERFGAVGNRRTHTAEKRLGTISENERTVQFNRIAGIDICHG